MSLSLHLYRAFTVIAPDPKPIPTGGGPQAAPAHPVPVAVGEAGEWFGPSAILAVALIVDATAAGSAAKRDRVAAVGTYAAAVGFISIYGLAGAIQGYFDSSWSMKITGSLLAVLAHLGFVAMLRGKNGRWSKRFHGKFGAKVGLGLNASDEVGKINTRLHVCAALAACTYVLARGDLAAIPNFIAWSITTLVAEFLNLLIEKLGG